LKAPTAIIADDERLMREQLRRRLGDAWPELQIVGEAVNGTEAVEQVAALRPDLAFLDIRMPGKTGIEAGRDIGNRCHIVFVTAYDAHAVEAFEQGAIDYVLKPADPERLAVTVRRLKARLAEQEPASNLAAVIERLEGLAGRIAPTLAPAPVRSAGYLQWIQAGLGQHLRLLPVDEVVFLQAQDKYTAVATAKELALVRKPIREFVDELDSDRFWQIHRGTLVAVKEIAAVNRDGEQLVIQLRNRPERLEVSRSFAGRFRQM
jgi:DNA-binding LytR/AlgR family response regulator